MLVGKESLLIKRLTTWGESALISPNQLAGANQGAGTFKEGWGSRVAQEEEGHVQSRTVTSDSHLDVGCVVV